MLVRSCVEGWASLDSQTRTRMSDDSRSLRFVADRTCGGSCARALLRTARCVGRRRCRRRLLFFDADIDLVALVSNYFYFAVVMGCLLMARNACMSSFLAITYADVDACLSRPASLGLTYRACECSYAAQKNAYVKSSIDAVKANTATAILLFGCGIGVEGAKALADALSTNTSVTTIDLRGEPFFGCSSLTHR